MRISFRPRPLAAAAALLLVAAGWIAAPLPTRLAFAPESRIWVTGTSTIHDWTCEVSSFDGAVEVPVPPGAPRAVEGVDVRVPVGSLDCKNGTMDKKASKALAADKHPNITFTLERLVPGATVDGARRVTAHGALVIAGARRSVAVEAVGFARADGTLRFTGEHALRMSDFGVDAPTAMLGTLKTGDEVTVHFDVVTKSR